MRNPYDKRVESQWRLGGWSEARLDRGQRMAWRLGVSLRCVGLMTGVCGVFLILPFAALMSLTPLFVSSLSLIGLGLAMDRLAVRCEERGEYLSKVSDRGGAGEALRRIEAAAVNSQRAREWKDDAAWSGRELRVFDVEAMEALAERERKGS